MVASTAKKASYAPVGHYKKVTFYFVKKRCEGNKLY
jgi:hypothetical protein